MGQRLALSFVFVACVCLTAAGEKQEPWLEVRSPHFTVVTDSSEKQGRRIADQFERMRSVFHVAFPKLEIDPGAPIIVIAAKNEKDFRALEPEDYLSKGSLKLGGLFLRAADKNYVLMRLDAEGDHPYAVVYHEYTHLLMNKSMEWMPLWMNEGLAEFYQTTDISEKSASLGQASRENILWLRQNRLLPLPLLFAVDQKSPYYHQENKGSIFYAESWALVHYLEFDDFKLKTHRLADYLNLVDQKVDPLTAATRAFGDLNRLQGSLENYVRQGTFSYLKMTTTTEVDDSAFAVRTLAAPQSDALRADFLAYNQRYADSESLLDRVLQADPNNISAHETKGFLAFRQGHLSEGRKWFAQAVQLDSHSYLAHYYFAAISMNEGGAALEEPQVESSLRTSIQLNPSFAPSFDRLAVLLAMRHRNLDEARMMGLTAISLEPSNVGYRINMANILMSMEKGEAAVEVLRYAAKLAKSPQDVQALDSSLMRAQEYAQSQARFAEQNRQIKEAASASTQSGSSNAGDIAHLSHHEFVARGPHRFVVGTLKGVRCDNPALDLTVTAKGIDLALHVDNYFKIRFSALGFQPGAALNPCADLENRPAKVEYVESANPSNNAQLLAVELHK